jgi:exodeoxyribonuclease V alpha subunit
MRYGELGIDNLNIELQKVMNPDREGEPKVTVNKFGNEISFKRKDKVLHLSNKNMDSMTLEQFDDDPHRTISKDKQKRIFNGYFGAVIKADDKNEVIWVYYKSDSVVVRYQKDDIEDLLSLGQSATIHKVQGSGFRNLVVPVTFSHYIMLSSRLLYTAITRAQKFCYLVGEASAFEHSCRNHKQLERNTVLQYV